MIQVFWADEGMLEQWDSDQPNPHGWYWRETDRPNEDPHGPFDTMAEAAKDEAEHRRAKSMLGLVRRGWLR